ncbi:MAG: CsbD family protein [Actinobacteria bacterium]|nr:CsbD family protein [Actinomycetota bacterium]
MSGKIDKAKGRAKKAAGDLAGDQSLKDRGRTDEAKGKAKRGLDKATSKVKKGMKRTY